MPLYEFYCTQCDGIFENLRTIREASEPAPCPVCSRDAERLMPTSFNAFTYREGYARRIPDKGTYWHLGKEVKTLVSGSVRPNEHPEINKPEPHRRPLKGDAVDAAEKRRLEARENSLQERERQAARVAYEHEQSRRGKSADAV